ncbi:MAG: restriction endonuclease [Lautropia sp.]|nr:restriction endonuclease [Lautropia sp.]
MDIPAYDIMFQPLLTLLNEQTPTPKSDLIKPLAQHFSLSDEDLEKTYDNRSTKVFEDRMSWTLSYLSMAKLLERPRRGHYRLTQLGKQYALKDNSDIKTYVKAQVAQRQNQNVGTALAAENLGPDASIDQNSLSPEDALSHSHNQIRDSLHDEILDTILSKDPTVLEDLAVKLLQKMGYGGALKDSGTTTPRSRDGGIDGEIRQDILGFERVYIQTKRYHRDNKVDREQIQAFVGALHGKKASKGVFITTSSYTKDAEKYANDELASQHVKLIDGQKLAEYIYEYDLGLQTKETLTLKKLDDDFWTGLKDDSKQTSGAAC